MRKETVLKVLEILRRSYPKGEKPWARRSDPFRTLISTMLSAQTTDDQVDAVTPKLFRRYPTPRELARAKKRDVEGMIKSVGLYKAKSGNIIAASEMLMERFKGKVPDHIDDLVLLPGVGRKTANVVLIKSYSKPAMPVDTHVFRVATRIGLSSGKTPAAVEAEIEGIIPKRHLGAAHFWFIHHGRAVCRARNPECGICRVAKHCRYFNIA